MYKRLVEALRNMDVSDACPCSVGNMCDDQDCIVYQAADAIEELEKAAPRWISVTEELPETRETIFGKKSSKVIVAFRFDDGTRGTDTAHTINGEWVFEDHITVVARTITHWMPLPEPKEET